MGSVGSSLYKIDQSNNFLTGDNNPTKFAKTLFDREYQQARLEMRRQSEMGREEEIYGYNSLIEDGDKVPSARDLRGVQFLVDKEIKQLEVDKKLGVITNKRYNILARALDSVQKTLNKEYRNGKKDGFYR